MYYVIHLQLLISKKNQSINVDFLITTSIETDRTHALNVCQINRFIVNATVTSVMYFY